jgi:3-oxoacyl-[acyl-carrier-protein] synthase II
VSPVGNTVEQAWSNVLAGKSGIGLITKFDTSAFACKIAGEVRDFDLETYISAKEARTMDSFIHYGIAAAVQKGSSEYKAKAESESPAEEEVV